MNWKICSKFLKIAYCSGIVGLTVLMSIRDSRTNLKHEAVIEAGSAISIDGFFDKTPDDAAFITDISSIDTSIPAIYNLKVRHDLIFTDTVSLKIEDTTGPSAEGRIKKIFSYEAIPEASDMVDHVYDISGVTSIEYAEKPDIKGGGIFRIPIRLTDNYGNQNVVYAGLAVISDDSAPVIHGINNITIVQGQTPDISTGIYATDNYSQNVSVRIDAGKLNKDVPGTYEIIYTATDDAGNKTREVSTVTVTKKPAPKKKVKKKTVSKKKTVTRVKKKAKTSYYSREADRMANALIKKLRRSNNVETARAIFNWVHKNVHYVHSSSRFSGKRAAYQGLKYHSGNCRVFAYTCQLLLNKAGIRNMIVTRYPITSTEHFWNLVYMNGGWYHCDATPFRSHPSVYFKLTDSQLDKYHRFKKSKYPARAKS